VFHLAKRHHYDWERVDRPVPYILNVGGIEKLLPSIPILAKTVQRLGIVVDADVAVADRWAAVRDRLREARIIDVPVAPVPMGWVMDVSGALPLERVGVWVMPDNRSVGILEDFIATLVPEGDPSWPIAAHATNEAIERGAPLAESQRKKGELYAWLAWREQPGRPFGQAITSNVLTHDAPLARAFMGWFERLFVD
jgi:hypothetical protein